MKILVNLLMIVIGLSIISCKKESDIKPWEVTPYEVEFVDNSLYGCRVDMVYHHSTTERGVYLVKNMTLKSDTLITVNEIVVAEIKISCNVEEGKDKVFFKIAPKDGNTDMFMLEFKDWKAYSNKYIYINDESLTGYYIDFYKQNR